MFMYCTKTPPLNTCTMYSGEVRETDRSYGLLQRWHRDVISGGGRVGRWGVRVVMSGIKKGDREHAELRLAITSWGDLEMEHAVYMYMYVRTFMYEATNYIIYILLCT